MKEAREQQQSQPKSMPKVVCPGDTEKKVAPRSPQRESQVSRVLLGSLLQLPAGWLALSWPSWDRGPPLSEPRIQKGILST